VAQDEHQRGDAEQDDRDGFEHGWSLPTRLLDLSYERRKVKRMDDCGFIKVTHWPQTGPFVLETLYAYGDFSQEPIVRQFHREVDELAAEMRAHIGL
jgi:hypothetical protein